MQTSILVKELNRYNVICTFINFQTPKVLIDENPTTFPSQLHSTSLNPSQFLSTSNWLKNHTSYLKPNRIQIEGGLALCAHTNKKFVFILSSKTNNQ